MLKPLDISKMKDSTQTISVAYPETFRRRYTGLGAQTRCPTSAI